MARILFEDIFEVLEKDPDGKQFDKGAGDAYMAASLGSST